MAYRRFFVVMDPQQPASEQIALRRARQLLGEEGGHIHGFAAVHGSSDRSSALAAAERKLGELLQSQSEAAVHVDAEVEWSRNPEQAAVRACSRLGADLLIKQAEGSEHYLLRHSPAPVLLCRPGTEAPYARVLAAIALEDNDARHEALNNRVISAAQRIARSSGAALHSVSALEGPPNVGQILKIIEDEDVEKLTGEEMISRSFGIRREQVHIDYGPARNVIVETAEKTAADLLVIGTVSRSGLSGALVGNTAEKLLVDLPIDILTVS